MGKGNFWQPEDNPPKIPVEPYDPDASEEDEEQTEEKGTS